MRTYKRDQAFRKVKKQLIDFIDDNVRNSELFLLDGVLKVVITRKQIKFFEKTNAEYEELPCDATGFLSKIQACVNENIKVPDNSDKIREILNFIKNSSISDTLELGKFTLRKDSDGLVQLDYYQVVFNPPYIRPNVSVLVNFESVLYYHMGFSRDDVAHVINNISLVSKQGLQSV